MEDDFEFNTPIITTTKTDHPKSATRKQQTSSIHKDLAHDDSQLSQLKYVTSHEMADW